MKKYIFTESQIKKIIDTQIENQINENEFGGTSQTPSQTGKLGTMSYENVKSPELITKIKTQGKFQVVNGTDIKMGIMLNNTDVTLGMIITKDTVITVPMGRHLIVSGEGFKQASIEYGDNGLVFNGYVA